MICRLFTWYRPMEWKASLHSRKESMEISEMKLIWESDLREAQQCLLIGWQQVTRRMTKFVRISFSSFLERFSARV